VAGALLAAGLLNLGAERARANPSPRGQLDTVAQAHQPATEKPAATAVPAEGAEPEPGHTDPFSDILLQLAVVIVAAVFGRWAASRFHQPAVLGELLIGVVVGNIGYWFQRPLFVLVMHLDSVSAVFRSVWNTGLSVSEAIQQVFSAAELAPGGSGELLVQILTGPGAAKFVLMGFAFWVFSSLGVILLLFMVGLESSVEEMMHVGARATLVAVVGIVAPFLLGVGASAWLLPGSPSSVHLFLGATLAATSVGITARVFKDLNKLHTAEAKVILGAAVIDDILGLIILAVVVGIVATGEVRVTDVARILVLAFMFLVTLIVFGDRIVRRTLSVFGRWERQNLKLLFPLTLCFVAAWMANLIGLAAIVGAFAAGLIVTEKHFEPYGDSRGTATELIAPLEALFAPVFFVLMGMQVNLASFLQPGTVGLALAFVVAALVGKLVAGLPAGRGIDRLSVGIGMIPRGEVGLIFASIGKGLGVVSEGVFSAVVIMVIVTTLITPIGLKWSLARATPANNNG
jgi:Kef-type K+ transport system membrane component KefB